MLGMGVVPPLGMGGDRGIGKSLEMCKQLGQVGLAESVGTTAWTWSYERQAAIAAGQPALERREADLEGRNNLLARHAALE